MVAETFDIAPTVLWSKPESERRGTHLLVLLHGYGANEADLFSLAEMLPERFTVAAVRAPMPAGAGFSWFPLTNSIEYSLDAVKKASEFVFGWLDGVRADHSSATLLGFSMGMAMATTLARHRPGEFAAVIGLSGFVVDAAGDSYFKDDELDGSLQVFWGRDQQDPVIPQERIDYSLQWLRKHTKLTKVLYTGMWHGINAQEIGHVGEFLTHHVLSS